MSVKQYIDSYNKMQNRLNRFDNMISQQHLVSQFAASTPAAVVMQNENRINEILNPPYLKHIKQTAQLLANTNTIQALNFVDSRTYSVMSRFQQLFTDTNISATFEAINAARDFAPISESLSPIYDKIQSLYTSLQSVSMADMHNIFNDDAIRYCVDIAENTADCLENIDNPDYSIDEYLSTMQDQLEKTSNSISINTNEGRQIRNLFTMLKEICISLSNSKLFMFFITNMLVPFVIALVSFQLGMYSSNQSIDKLNENNDKNTDRIISEIRKSNDSEESITQESEEY